MVEQIQEHTIGSATEKMKEGAVELKKAVAETAVNTFDQYCEEATSMIKENPYASLGIAFGVGALFGIFFLRR